MFNFRERALALLALLLLFPALIFAQNPPAATFFLRDTETQFSVNVANDSSDVFIYFTSPAYSWVGFGFGDSMKDSLMIILYPNAKNDNVTISPRIGNRNAEPTYSPEIKIEALPGTNITDDMFVLRAICRNCKVWPNGFIDEENRARPMIYAFGHGTRIQSDSPSANLRRHIRYGHFTMDLVSATGQGGVPAKSNAESGVVVKQGMTRDHDRASLAHALMGCVAMFVLWPLNVITAGFFRRIKIHVGVSVLILVFLVVSYALGIHTSYQYNRSKAFNTPHQILAFLTLAPLLLMSILPIRPLANLHSIIPRIHTPLSTASFFFLVLTGGLGFILSSQARPIILGYSAVAIGVCFFIVLLQACIKRRGSAYARASTRRRLGEEDDRDLMLARYFAGRKVKDEQKLHTPTTNHSRSPSATSQGGYYGGGTMPGPQYLMNMHPGVPVHRWSVVEGSTEHRETRPGWKRL